MTILGESTRKARKPHKCYWCGEEIPAKTQYVRWCSAQDGIAEEIKVHNECKDAWHEAASEWGGEYEAAAYEHERGKW